MRDKGFPNFALFMVIGLDVLGRVFPSLSAEANFIGWCFVALLAARLAATIMKV